MVAEDESVLLRTAAPVTVAFTASYKSAFYITYSVCIGVISRSNFHRFNYTNAK